MAYLYVVTPEKQFLLFKGSLIDNKFIFKHPIINKRVKVNVSKTPGEIYCDRLWLADKDDEKANELFKQYDEDFEKEIISQKDISKSCVVFYKCNQKKCNNCSAKLGQCTNTMSVKYAKNPEFSRKFIFDFAFGNYREVE